MVCVYMLFSFLLQLHWNKKWLNLLLRFESWIPPPPSPFHIHIFIIKKYISYSLWITKGLDNLVWIPPSISYSYTHNQNMNISHRLWITNGLGNLESKTKTRFNLIIWGWQWTVTFLQDWLGIMCGIAIIWNKLLLIQYDTKNHKHY